MKKGIAALVTATVLMMSFAAPSWAGKSSMPLVGDEVPPFSISMLSGKTVNSVDLFAKNKVVLITFLQTACSLCKAEITELQKLVKDYKGGVVVLPIAVDMRTGKEFLENYKAENAVDFDFGIDPKFTVPPMFGFSFTPSSVVVTDGKISHLFRGYDEEIRKEVDQLFKK